MNIQQQFNAHSLRITGRPLYSNSNYYSNSNSNYSYGSSSSSSSSSSYNTRTLSSIETYNYGNIGGTVTNFTGQISSGYSTSK